MTFRKPKPRRMREVPPLKPPRQPQPDAIYQFRSGPFLLYLGGKKGGAQ